MCGSSRIERAFLSLVNLLAMHARAAACRRYTVGGTPHMETIQVVLDAKLFKAADLAAKRQKVKCSAPIRQALQEHLKRLRTLRLEEFERRGYEKQPQFAEEF